MEINFTMPVNDGNVLLFNLDITCYVLTNGDLKLLGAVTNGMDYRQVLCVCGWENIRSAAYNRSKNMIYVARYLSKMTGHAIHDDVSEEGMKYFLQEFLKSEYYKHHLTVKKRENEYSKQH